MQGSILLNIDEDVISVEEEEKKKFLFDLLSDMGIELDLPEDEIQARIKLNNLLKNYDIQVIYGDDMCVYVGGELVGKWHKCTYKMKTDLSEIDPKKRIYKEMFVNYFSIFEKVGE